MIEDEITEVMIMDKILYVNTCVRKESRTNRLAHSLLERLRGEVTEIGADAEGILLKAERELKP